jgi:hypothetical protein
VYACVYVHIYICVYTHTHTHTHLVGARMVDVMLVAPPGRAHTTADVAEGAHQVGPLAAPVHVIVREPPGNRIRDAQHGRCQKLHVQHLELLERDATAVRQICICICICISIYIGMRQDV